MKRLLCLLLAALTVLGLGACGEKSGAPAGETAFPTTASEEPKPLQTLPLETAPSKDTGESGFVDLTALSSTMVYAEVFAMMSSPEDYVGKTVKMQGIFSKGQLYAAGSLNDGGTVFACVIQDATACCAQGIPFELAGDHTYPQDYPELGDTITVVGTFEIHQQEGMQFCRLRDAELVS
mgnify:FL=1